MKFIASVLILFSLLLVSCAESGLPEVTDPETLRTDCALLYKQFPIEKEGTNLFLQVDGRIIPTNNWPASVRALSPYRVMRDKYAVSIWVLRDVTEPGKKWMAVGYYVRENHNLQPPRIAHGGWGGEFDLKYTSNDGIDVFYLPYMVE
jgi:hypothetical protein